METLESDTTNLLKFWITNALGTVLTTRATTGIGLIATPDSQRSGMASGVAQGRVQARVTLTIATESNTGDLNAVGLHLVLSVLATHQLRVASEHRSAKRERSPTLGSLRWGALLVR